MGLFRGCGRTGHASPGSRGETPAGQTRRRLAIGRRAAISSSGTRCAAGAFTPIISCAFCAAVTPNMCAEREVHEIVTLAGPEAYLDRPADSPQLQHMGAVSCQTAGLRSLRGTHLGPARHSSPPPQFRPAALAGIPASLCDAPGLARRLARGAAGVAIGLVLRLHARIGVLLRQPPAG